VTTIAGTGATSSINGPIGSATYNNIYDVVITDNGDIYTLDVTGWLRKTTSTTVSMIAGNGSSDTNLMNDGFNSSGITIYGYMMSLHPNGAQVAIPDTQSRVRLHDLDPTGYSYGLIGDRTAANANGIAEICVAETSFGHYYFSASGAVPLYVPLPVPVRVPAGLRLAVMGNHDASVGSSTTYNVRGLLAPLRSFE
jgi:hypothetical protein